MSEGSSNPKDEDPVDDSTRPVAIGEILRLDPTQKEGDGSSPLSEILAETGAVALSATESPLAQSSGGLILKGLRSPAPSPAPRVRGISEETKSLQPPKGGLFSPIPSPLEQLRSIPEPMHSEPPPKAEAVSSAPKPIVKPMISRPPKAAPSDPEEGERGDTTVQPTVDLDDAIFADDGGRDRQPLMPVSWESREADVIDNLDETEAMGLLGPEEVDKTLATDAPVGMFAEIPDPEDELVPRSTVPLDVVGQQRLQQAPTAIPRVIGERAVPQVVPTAKPVIPAAQRVAPTSDDELMPSEPSVILNLRSEDHDEMEAAKTGIFEPPDTSGSLPRGRLYVESGGLIGKTWYLNRPRTMLGRGTENEIVLLDIQVSRHHCRLDRHQGGFRLIDLESGNGTMVNGRRITRCEIYDGDRIEIGGLVLVYSTVGLPRQRDSQPSRVTDPSIGVVVTPTRSERFPALWLAMWFVATFAAVVGALLLTRYIMRGEAPPSAAVTIQQDAKTWKIRAEEAISAREWGLARQNLEVAQSLAPELMPYAELMAKVDAEVKAERDLKQAQAQLQMGDVSSAVEIARGIASGSVYRAEAEALIQEAGKKALKPSEVEADKDRAPAEAPSKERTALGTNQPGHERQVAPPPKESGDSLIKKDMLSGLRHYKRGRFADAVVAYERGARRKGSKKLRARSRGRARAAERFAKSWPVGVAAMDERKYTTAVTALAKALKDDRKLGGHYGGQIRSKLAKACHFLSVKALSKKKLDEAGKWVERGLGYKSGDPNLLKVKAKVLKEKAKSGLTK